MHTWSEDPIGTSGNLYWIFNIELQSSVKVMEIFSGQFRNSGHYYESLPLLECNEEGPFHFEAARFRHCSQFVWQHNTSS